mmetsp:Transcript_22792/g.53177  ORF Transcript_22792/g.53177 Transcript_22792/m.53177 type:complete len:109 (-) Transcript_22792:97-423(-)
MRLSNDFECLDALVSRRSTIAHVHVLKTSAQGSTGTELHDRSHTVSVKGQEVREAADGVEHNIFKRRVHQIAEHRKKLIWVKTLSEVSIRLYHSEVFTQLGKKPELPR